MLTFFSDAIRNTLIAIFIGFFCIILRIWHLGLFEKEQKQIEAQKPQLKTILTKANRGVITDRFGIPMAVNKICYNAVIYYGQFQQIPVIRWQEDQSGKKIKIWPRKEYIQKLSNVLSKILTLPKERIEDLIYAKAALFPHAPFLLKINLSAEEHYQLKNLERNWLGIHAEIGSRRYYPLGKTGCHILGCMGALGAKEFRQFHEELNQLQESIALYEEKGDIILPEGYSNLEDVYFRFQELQEKAYTLTDQSGKMGIEKQCEEELRGFFGKKTFEIDPKGKFVRELQGAQAPIHGHRVTLTLSSELQQFAEELLIKSEKERDGKSQTIDPADHTLKTLKQPWIKGGAVVALDPKTGEIIALASVPRFDPNDFVSSLQNDSIHYWLETMKYKENIWNGTQSLYRESFRRKIVDEIEPLSWNSYVHFLFPSDHPIFSFFQNNHSIQSMIDLQEAFEIVHYFAQEYQSSLKITDLACTPDPTFIDPELQLIQKKLIQQLKSIPHPEDKIFTIDLAKTIIHSSRFSDDLIRHIGSMSLEMYWDLRQEFLRLSLAIEKTQKQQFHETDFSAWKIECQKKFLDEKRKEEKERKTYARPYLDYLDKKEAELFKEYWGKHRITLILEKIKESPLLAETVEALPSELREEFLKTFRSAHELDLPLWGQYKRLKTEKDLALAFYPKESFGCLRSYAFQTAAPAGSIFKLVTSYEALRQGAALTLIDESGPRLNRPIIARSLQGKPYPRIYKGGKLPRSSIFEIGKIDLLGALEQSSNPYFSILAGDYLKDPNDLKEAAALFGYGSKTGIDLPGETAGHLPKDLSFNRTGLYSFAIGQHTLLATPLQTTMMLGAIATKGEILKPKIILQSKGNIPAKNPLSPLCSGKAFAEKELKSVGVHFSLFTKMQKNENTLKNQKNGKRVRRKIAFSDENRNTLMEGMERALWSSKGNARPSTIRSLQNNPELRQEFLSLKHELLGKTGTAQIMINPYIYPSSKPSMYIHGWFGSIHLEDYHSYRYDHPDLIVVVFLRYTNAGKEGAPIAAQIIQKWKQIKQQHD